MGKKSTLSFLPLRGMVLFPNNGAHIDIGRDKSVAALEECLAHGRQIMLSVQKDVEVEDPKREDVYEIGTVCQVQHVTKLNNGIMRAQIEGLYRARILDFRDDGLFIEVDVEEIEEDKTDNKNNKDNNSNADKTDKDTETTGKLEPADDMTQDKEDTKKDDEDGADDNIFDNPVLPDDKDDRPTDAEDSLSDEEKEERAALNHTCDGITVSGVNLPWYVQFRVSSGDSYQFTNESDAMIFQSYEFELWDLKNNTEYEIPNGDYISVTVPVKSGYQYTIEHLLDNGATETIIPSVENGIMVFSTHSFSPFGIAGSKTLVGEEIEDGSYSSGTTTTASTTVSPTTASSSTTTAANSSTSGTSVQSSADQSGTDNSTSDQGTQSGSRSVKAVSTGDSTPILPFVIIGIAAAVIVAVLVYLKKRK